MRRFLLTSFVGFIFAFAVRSWFYQPSGISPLPESSVVATAVVDGTTYKFIEDGRVFRVHERAGKWFFLDTMFFPAEMAAAYQVDDGKTYRVSEENGKRYLVLRNFAESFDELPVGVDGFRSMMKTEQRWGSVTLQSPETPTVNDYVKLRQRILNEGANFGDALVAPDSTHAFHGLNSLKCVSPPCPKKMICCKSSLSSPLVYFRKGDDFWFRAFFFAEGSLPTTIMDLECEWIKLHAGIRLIIDQSGCLGAELKSLDKPKYRQARENAIKFPMNQWVEVRSHFQLSEKPDGVIQVWQDSQLIIDTHGTTLPISSAIYSSLEVGISAHSSREKAAILWVDDLEISDMPIE